MAIVCADSNLKYIHRGVT